MLLLLLGLLECTPIYIGAHFVATGYVEPSLDHVQLMFHNSNSVPKMENVCAAGPTGNRILRKTHGDKAHGDIKSIVVSSLGSIIWTAGHNNMGLWDAHTGSFLGRIEADRNEPTGGVVNFDEKEKKIDPNKVGGEL